LPQNIEEMSILVHRVPEIMALTLKDEKHCIQVPLVSWSGLSAPELIRILLPKLAVPLPNRFVSHRDTACKQSFFDSAIAEAATAIAPYRVADELDGAAVVLLAVDGWCVHAPSMAYQASVRPAA